VNSVLVRANFSGCARTGNVNSVLFELASVGVSAPTFAPS
jgi:hypothetical protein